MNSKVQNCILNKILNRNDDYSIVVNGDSMFPVLNSGDTVQIIKKSHYKIGDILVFYYNDDESFIVHRLLLKYNGFLYCKGDNSFRLEQILEKDIIGCVTHKKRDAILEPIPNPSKDFIAHSLKVHFAYCQLGYDREKTIKSDIYIQYKTNYLNAKL